MKRPVSDRKDAMPMRLISRIIPMRNEEDAAGSTVEHLHVDLRIRHIPHAIVVMDDGSTDSNPGALTEHSVR